MNAQRLREAMSAIPQLKDPEIRRTLWTVLQEASDRDWEKRTFHAASVLRRRGKPELQWTPTRTHHERKLEHTTSTSTPCLPEQRSPRTPG